MNHDQTTSISPVTSLSWSSDEKYIAVGTTNGETVVWDVASEQISATLTAVGSTYVTWSPDSNWLATVNADIVYVSSPMGSMFSSTVQKIPFKVTALAWSPDSKYIAVGGQDGEANLYVWSPCPNATPGTTATDGGHAFLFHFKTSGVDVSSLAWSPDGSYIAMATDSAYLIEINKSLLNS